MDQQSLLRWGIEHAAPDSLLPLSEDIKAGHRPDLNSDVLKAIMGVSDADRMIECMQVIEGKFVNRDGVVPVEEGSRPAVATKEDKLLAWDDLEMLIEDMDNANNLQNMGLWTPIIKYLSDADEDVVMRACWVCGTAVQNNPKAQEAFLALDPLPTILPIVTSTTLSAGTRSKAMYCLSSTLKHSEAAVSRFAELDGWSFLNQSLQDPSLTLRSKCAFLLSQLVSQSPSPSTLLTSLRSSSVLSTLLSSLSPSNALPTGPNGDVEALDPDYQEKALRVLVNITNSTPEGLEEAERKEVREVVRRLEEEGVEVEDLGLAKEEWEAFKKAVGSPQ